MRFGSIGRKRQRRKREYMRILKPVEVIEGSKFIGVYPGDGYQIDYTIDFPRPIGRESLRVDLESGDYDTLIAPARTFGFREDEAMLRDMGLIRGASAESAIILTREGVENGPLRFDDEFVRHKVLDLIGDLALAGRRIWGRVVAERAGHAMHTALVQRLLRDRSAWEFANHSQLAPETKLPPGARSAGLCCLMVASGGGCAMQYHRLTYLDDCFFHACCHCTRV